MNSKRNEIGASRAGIVLTLFILIFGFLLFTEHRAHALGALPWLILLACPLMHVFMHGGHGGHGGPSSNRGAAAADAEEGP